MDLSQRDEFLCILCRDALPGTHFINTENNPVEKVFFGRLPVFAAHSEFYFSKKGLVQQLIHRLKYNGDKPVGQYLGRMMGHTLLNSGRIGELDYLIPLPLHAEKEFKRGYNQAEVVCNGIMESTGIPVLTKNVVRVNVTSTQTRKSRMDRWENVKDVFSVQHPEQLKHKKILLVDDVLTTGATLEACGRRLTNIPGVQLAIATLAYAISY